MTENQWNPTPPAEGSTYRTGPMPPKKKSGLIAVLLVLVILLGAATSALGMLNIKLFRSLSDKEETTLRFSSSKTEKPQLIAEETTKTETDHTADVSLNLQDTPESTDNTPQEGALSLQAIYEKAIPSVVSISCQTAAGTSTGTGVVFSEDGYIVTNCHVVESAYSISVILHNEEVYDAALVGADSISDLAVLHIDAENLSPAEFGNSDALRVGDTVVAIGDPLGIELRGTMTDGIVSAINRDITASGRTMTLIQTNAALNSGNSGGPLINCYGQVIGINTMKIGDFMDSAGVEGLGFAIPTVTVETIVSQLVSQGYVAGRPSLGFTSESVSPFLQMYYNLPQGVYITYVEPGSSADQLGIEAGDILLSMDNVRITDTEVLSTCLYSHTAGDEVEIIIYRSGQQYKATLTLDQATN